MGQIFQVKEKLLSHRSVQSILLQDLFLDRRIDVFKLKRISRHHSCEKKCNGDQGKQAHKTEQNPFSNVFDHSGFRPSSGFLTGTNFAWFISGCCRRIAPSLLQTMTQEPQ